ncbi:MAG: lytic transglycosylase domain-containing protein [Paucibacter sp.]|nr:lytic transglycosylase domain-containing protein [Roseateles sp.]
MAVYGSPRLIGLLVLGLALFSGAQAQDTEVQNQQTLAAHAAFVKRDRAQLAQLAAQSAGNPLAPWIEYWALNVRLGEATQADLDAFYARWRGSYVEDRLRNDWLLELGHRRDWKNFQNDYAAYKMRDDREVLCFALLADHLAGKKVASEARAAWLAQREGDEGCQMLAATLFDAKLLSPADVWLKLRLSIEAGRPRAAKLASSLLGAPVELAVAEIQDKAGKYLSRKARSGTPREDALTTLALMRVAASDPDQAESLLKSRWQRALPPELAAWAWTQAARQAAMRVDPRAAELFEHALETHGRAGAPEWSGDTLAWMTRAALRVQRWPLVLQAIAMMDANQQREPQWQYWRARALIAGGNAADATTAGELLRNLAEAPNAALTFYGQLAAEDLHKPVSLPQPPAPLTAGERSAARATPGVQRALLLLSLGMRSEGLREWNFSMRGLSDRELRAAAQEACDAQAWDRCISASERTRFEMDIAQRYPLPYRDELMAATLAAGVEPAYAYGLIHQESRFVFDSRSHVGAAGLMQLMPPTAKWVAKKQGIPFKPETLYETPVNLRIGAGYLRMVLDSFKGSLPLAAAAYNAGPSRPRRWREGTTLDAAIWTETIPFWETRDYVKKVLINTIVYSRLLGGADKSLRDHLGRAIGPVIESPDTDAPPPAS